MQIQSFNWDALNETWFVEGMLTNSAYQLHQSHRSDKLCSHSIPDLIQDSKRCNVGDTHLALIQIDPLQNWCVVSWRPYSTCPGRHARLSSLTSCRGGCKAKSSTRQTSQTPCDILCEPEVAKRYDPSSFFPFAETLPVAIDRSLTENMLYVHRPYIVYCHAFLNGSCQPF